MAIYQDPNDPSNYPEGPTPGDPTAPYGTPVPPPTTPAPTTPAQTDPWDTAPADGNWQTWFLNNVKGLTPNSATLIGLEPKLNKHGIQVLRNASGIAGKIRLPDGSVWDVGRSFSGSDPSAMAWQWLGGSDAAAPADAAPIEINPDYLAPWTKEFTYADFKGPNASDLLQDPSYQWRLDQGRGALENSAAAKGLLNSGGTLAEILNYGQGMGSQEFSNVWDRWYNTWNANRDQAWSKFLDEKDSWYANQNNPWNKQRDAATIGRGAIA